MVDIKKQVHTCYHCGNTGLQNFIGQTKWNYTDIIRDENGAIIMETVLEHEDWYIFECPVCNKPVVMKQDVMDFAEYTFPPTIEFPSIGVSSEGVPKEIYSAFEAATKTKGIDRAICLLSLRRVLEMICKEKDAEGKDLEAMIDDLITKNVLSSSFADACWIIRQMGNGAAHADELTVYEVEVQQVISFVSTIIDYLYSMPCRVGKMKKRIEEQKKRKASE